MVSFLVIHDRFAWHIVHTYFQKSCLSSLPVAVPFLCLPQSLHERFF